MSIKFKQGVDTDGVKRELISAMSVVADYMMSNYGRDLVVTSVLDGRHKTNSKHYEGLAFDVRTWTTERSGIQLKVSKKRYLAYMFKKILGDDFDIVVEATHIHVELDK